MTTDGIPHALVELRQIVSLSEDRLIHGASKVPSLGGLFQQENDLVHAKEHLY